MTLPNTPSIAATSDVGSPLSTEQAVAATPDAQMPMGAEAPHLDYNLHPLKVKSLDHYTEQPNGDERFHIS